MRWGLRDPGAGPPGGWTFKEPTTAWVGEASSIHSLAHQIIRHWEANSMPMKDVFYEIAQQICEKAGSRYCYDMDNPSDVPNRPSKSTGGFGWMEFWNGTLNLGRWALKGRNFVSQEEATKRAEKCVACPNNLPVEACLPCKFKQAAMEVSKGVVHGLTTPFDSQLKICDVCKCSTKVLAHVYDPSYMNDEIPADQLERYKAVNCWKIK